MGELAWVTSPDTYVLAGVTTFVLAVLYAIVRGGLEPSATADKREAVWRDRLAESKEQAQIWREAYGESEAARRAQGDQIDQLIVLARTTEALLKALPQKEPTE